MARVIHDKENDMITVAATRTSGNEVTLQYRSPHLVFNLPGNASPTDQIIYDLRGGFSLRGDGAQSLVSAYILGLTSSTSGRVSTRLRESPEELLRVFREAGFPEPPVKTLLRTHIGRAARALIGAAPR